MKKIVIVGVVLIGFVVALITVGVVGFFVMFERGEKPLSASQVEQRLVEAGFEIEPQEKLLLYANDEALLPEKPGNLQTLRLRHPDIGSSVVTAASFSNEKAAHSLKGKTRGFSSRNWFFFGGVDTVMTKRIQDTLEAGENEFVYRLKTSDQEPKPLVPATQEANAGKAVAGKPKPEEILTREEVLGRFKAAGLSINRIEEDKDMPGSIKKKLPVAPLDDFLLFIEQEGVFPIEFKTPEDAIKMQQSHKKGFRHGNWYFPGQITAELRKKLVNALAGP